MSEPKRYDVGMRTENNPHGFNHSFHWIYEAEQGRYVEYADYARLKAEVERLTKAGDGLAWFAQGAFTVGFCDKAAKQHILSWNAAKEGKQS